MEWSVEDSTTRKGSCQRFGRRASSSYQSETLRFLRRAISVNDLGYSAFICSTCSSIIDGWTPTRKRGSRSGLSISCWMAAHRTEGSCQRKGNSPRTGRSET